MRKVREWWTNEEDDSLNPSHGEVYNGIPLREASPARSARAGPDPSNVAYRALDGSGNPSADSHLNAVGTAVERLGPAYFADGISELREGPNPRTISNVVVGEGDPNVPNAQGVSAFM